MFLNICSQSVQCNFPWPYTANSIVNQLTQLFSHLCIQAYTDYWNVRPAVRPYVLNSVISVLMLNCNSYIYGFKTHSVLVYCIGLEFNLNSYIYGFGTHSVFVYCSGLNSAIFTEWDSFQCLYTALVLNAVIFSLLGLNSVLVYCSGLNSAIFTEWDSFQYSYTALVLNSTVIAIFTE